MKIGVLSVIATMLAIIVINCAGTEIVPAAPVPLSANGNGDPLAALYAPPPADVAFITVADDMDVEADIVTAADVPFDAANFFLFGYGYELVLPFAEAPAWDAPLEVLDLELAAADAVARPVVHVDVDARFAEALAAAAAADAQQVVERGPEMQLEGWEAAALDAK